MSDPPAEIRGIVMWNGVDEILLSLYAKGLTTGEISAHSRRSGAYARRLQRLGLILSGSHATDS